MAYDFHIPEGPILPVFDEDMPEMSNIVEAYIGRLANTQVEIKSALSLKDWHQLKKMIHNIKGTANSFGFPLLSEITKVLHTHLATENYDEVPALVSGLHIVVDKIIEGNNLKQAQEASCQK